MQGAHFVQTPDYVQVTGVGDFTKINIPSGNTGGELDPHGADGNGESVLSICQVTNAPSECMGDGGQGRTGCACRWARLLRTVFLLQRDESGSSSAIFIHLSPESYF